MSVNGFVSGLVSGLKNGVNIAEAYQSQQDQRQYYQSMQQHWQAQDVNAAKNGAGIDTDALMKAAPIGGLSAVPATQDTPASEGAVSAGAVSTDAPAQSPQPLPVAQGQPSQDQFLQAVAQTESSGNPAAVNPDTGAAGLYQVMPSNMQPGQDPNRVGAVMATAAYNAYPDNPTAAYLYHHNGPAAAAQYAAGHPVTNAGPQTAQALTNFNKNLQATVGSPPAQAPGALPVAPVTPAGNTAQAGT